MNQLEGRWRLAEVLGVQDGSIRWGRALALALALALANMVAIAVRGCVGSSDFRWWHPMLLWSATFGCLVITAYLLLFFFLFRNQAAAVIVSAIALAVPIAPVQWLVFFNRLPEPDFFLHSPWIQLYRLLWFLLFLLGFSLALRWVKPVWLAAGLGTGAGLLIAQAVWLVAARVAPESWGWISFEPRAVSVSVLDGRFVAASPPLEGGGLKLEVYAAIPSIFFAVVFALALWVGLRLSESKKASSPA